MNGFEGNKNFVVSELQKRLPSNAMPKISQIKVAERIYNYVASSLNSSTESQIYLSVAGKKTSKVFALRLLVTVGLITRSESGCKGNPYRYKVGVLDEPGDDQNPPVSQNEINGVQFFTIRTDSDRKVFKKLSLNDGQVLEVNKEDFDSIVNFFRKLNEQASSIRK